MSETNASTTGLQANAGLDRQVWLARLSRELVVSGELQALIAEHAVQGAASLDALRLSDVQRACDLFAPLYQNSGCRAGFVSVGVSPRLAQDAAGAAAEARRLWSAVGRPNAMIGMPATGAGIAALEELVFAGIHVNATLVFGPRQLAAVRGAHRRGLARRLEAKLSVQRIASVASIAIGRVGAAIDALLPPGAAHLKGKAALAAARLACRDGRDDSGFAVFAAFGAAPLRLLWTDTGAGCPAVRGAPYMEELNGEGAEDGDQARAVLAQLGRHGIELDTIGNDLLREGLTQFERAHANLLALLA